MAVTLRIQNVNTYIEGVFPRDAVDRALSFYVPGFFHAPLFKNCQKCQTFIHPKAGRCRKCGSKRAWDGKKHLLGGGKTQKPYFPTGCLPLVVHVLRQNGITAIYRDERNSGLLTAPEKADGLILHNPDSPGEFRTPFPEQIDAIKKGLYYTRGIIQTPTGGGKTTIMAGLAKLIPEPAVILIHNTTIANQIKAEVQAMLGEEVGMIKGGVFDPRRVTVCMTQSLTGHLGMDAKSKKDKIPPLPEAVEFVKRVRLLMMDEAHHGSSNTWYNLCKAFENAYYRFGVTGTAFMRAAGDDLLLIGATGGLIYELSEQELIKQGRLALPIIHMYKIQAPEIAKDLQYSDVYQQGVVDNPHLNMLCAKMVKNLNKVDAQILVLCERLEHIQNIETHLKGVKYEILTGDTPEDERETAKEQFAKGDLKVIIATKIFDEGVSINNIDVVIRMGLMKTDIKTKQQVGRGQRKKKDKPNVVHIIDFLHMTHRYLAEHSLAHYDMYKKLCYPIIVEDKPLENLDCSEEILNGIKSDHPEAG